MESSSKNDDHDHNNKPSVGCNRRRQNLNAESLDSTEPTMTTHSNILVEFAINFNHQSDLAKIEEAFKSQGLAPTNVDVDSKIVQVDIGVKHKQTSGGGDALLLPDIRSLQELIERQTGFVTVVKGVGQVASAVAELRPPPPPSPSEFNGNNKQRILGIVRLSQMTNGSCYVDGSISGSLGGDSTNQQQQITTDNQAATTEKGGESEATRESQAASECLLAIHEYGDLSGQDYENIGSPWVKLADLRLNLGRATLDNTNNSTIPIREVVPDCDISSVIGKSIALSRFQSSGVQECANGPNGDDHSGNREVLSAGVVARASIVGSNKKQVCSCSGKTLWEERMDQQKLDKSGQ